MAQAQPPPPLLVQALKANAELRLPDLAGRAVFLVRDMDRDKREDVVAVVVAKSPGGLEYGVIAVHASAPQEIHWVVPLDADQIHGLAEGKAADTVVPLFCVDCDSNIWLRWAGDEYEAELFAVGEQIEIGSETQADLPLYSSPNLASKPVTTVSHCTTASVLKVGGTPDQRWYFVETAEGQRGWVSDAVTSGEFCVG